jgi:hypothetical protein
MEPSNYPRPQASQTRPFWVTLTMVGLKSRKAVVFFGWLSLTLAVASLIVALFFSLAIVGVILALAAWPYFATVKWMDANDGWKR